MVENGEILNRTGQLGRHRICLGLVAGPAHGLQVAVCVRAAPRFGNAVVEGEVFVRPAGHAAIAVARKDAVPLRLPLGSDRLAIRPPTLPGTSSDHRRGGKGATAGAEGEVGAKLDPTAASTAGHTRSRAISRLTKISAEARGTPFDFILARTRAS